MRKYVVGSSWDSVKVVYCNLDHLSIRLLDLGFRLVRMR